MKQPVDIPTEMAPMREIFFKAVTIDSTQSNPFLASLRMLESEPNAMTKRIAVSSMVSALKQPL